MKVILIKNVPNLGQSGMIKEVAEGYARNYLLPRNLVEIFSNQAVKEQSDVKNRQQKAIENKSKKYKEIAKKLNNIKIIIKVKADEKKTLFGSVNAQKIAGELKSRNYNVENKFIKLEQPIKTLGYYDVALDFGAGVTAKIGLTIVREE